MSTLTSGELNRLRHIIAEQANTAQAREDDAYLSLGRLDAQDVASALEELVALRTQEEDMARRDREKAAIVETRTEKLEEEVDVMQEALDDLSFAVDRLREAVES